VKADAKELQQQRDFTERLGTAEAEAARAHANLSRLRASEAKAALAASAAESARERLEVRRARPAGRLGGAAVGASAAPLGERPSGMAHRCVSQGCTAPRPRPAQRARRPMACVLALRTCAASPRC
jgi:hypothetical protein